jgi:hypothetical protein
MAKMHHFLARHELLPLKASTYLDVASCYGWFVSAFGRLGYESNGVELDPLAKPIGETAFQLQANQISTEDCVEFLRQANRTWDVVSCFSLLHHFILSDAAVTASQLLNLLDKVTDHVLFLDSGEAHEAWFAKTMPGWSAARLKRFIVSNTSFNTVIDLGPDNDRRPPYSDNYGRHLFACVRRPRTNSCTDAA